MATMRQYFSRIRKGTVNQPISASSSHWPALTGAERICEEWQRCRSATEAAPVQTVIGLVKWR